jgi:hypothetical protein
MRNKVQAVLTALFAGYIIYLFFAGHDDNFLSLIFRWGELTVIFFMIAGIIKYILNQVTLIKEPGKRLYPAIIVISFSMTVFAGFFNLFSEKFVWENSVREHPEFLSGISMAVIESDTYFKHHPAKNKLALFVSGRVFSDYTPSDTLLKKSSMKLADYRLLLAGSKDAVLYDKTVFNSDDMRNIGRLVERTTTVSRSMVSILNPAMNDIKQWFTDSLFHDIENNEINDLAVSGTVIKGTGDILKENIKIQLSSFGRTDASVYNSLISFNNFISSEEFVSKISETFKDQYPDYLTSYGAQIATASFMNTGYSRHIPVRGVLRWIYRNIFDPLYSTFMAVILITMLLALLRVINVRSFSYSVISVSVLFSLIGFLPFTSGFIKLLPDGWKGPLSQNWLMNVPSLSVFRAVVIGVGIGVIFTFFNKISDFYKNNGISDNEQ